MCALRESVSTVICVAEAHACQHSCSRRFACSSIQPSVAYRQAQQGSQKLVCNNSWCCLLLSCSYGFILGESDMAGRTAGAQAAAAAAGPKRQRSAVQVGGPGGRDIAGDMQPQHKLEQSWCACAAVTIWHVQLLCWNGQRAVQYLRTGTAVVCWPDIYRWFCPSCIMHPAVGGMRQVSHITF